MIGTASALSRSAIDTSKVPTGRHVDAGGDHGLMEGSGEGSVHTHDLAGRLHFGSEISVDAGELARGEHGRLDRTQGSRWNQAGLVAQVGKGRVNMTGWPA